MIPSVLSSQLIQGTKDFLSTIFPSNTPAFFDMMDTFINEEGKLFKGPYISVALPFRTGDADTHYFPDTLSQNFKPFYHQELAFKRLGGERPQPTLVSAGTRVGKTEAFMYLILDYCYQNREKKGIKGINIYPMNALATDQAKRFAKTIQCKKDRL